MNGQPPDAAGRGANPAWAQSRWPVAIFVVLCMLLAVTLYQWVRKPDLGVTLLLVVCAALIFFCPVLDRLRSFKVSAEGFEATLQEALATAKLADQTAKQAKEQVEDLSQEVADLFLAAMGEEVLRNFEKLANGEFSEFWFPPENTGLRRELQHLSNIGFIRFDGPGYEGEPKGIEHIPAGTPGNVQRNLNEWVQVTDAGRKFLRLKRLSHAPRPQEPRPVSA